MSPTELRILVVRENWLGCTGLSAFDAFLRTGAWVDSCTESEYIPLKWRNVVMKGVGKLGRSLAVCEFNDDLVRLTRRIRPHLFFAVMGPWVSAGSLEAMHRLGVTRFCFYPDVSVFTHGRYLPHAMPHYDWVFTTKSFGIADMRDKLGITNSSYLPHAYDPLVHFPRTPSEEDKRRFQCDVSFIGSWSKKKESILESLLKLRPNLNLKIWGNRWFNLARESPLRKCTTFEPADGIGYATAISCSKVNLGLLHEAVFGASSGDQITSRTFHIPACGGFMLHERTHDLQQIFKEGENCECFGSPEELALKIESALSDRPRRESIAKRGRELVQASHSWDHRVQTILGHLRQQLSAN